MMAAARFTGDLIERLPAVRGRIVANAELAKSTWFRVGGPAEVMFWPVDAADLQSFLGAKDEDVPVTIIGIGSNLLVRDGGVPGVVVRLSDGFTEMGSEGLEITAEGGVSNLKLANMARDRSIAGFEFLSGIPGSIGGALRMNAGAYGAEVKDIVQSATVIDGNGELVKISVEDLNYSYRHSDAPSDYVFIEGVFKGEPGKPEEIDERMKAIRAERELTQPVKTPTGGSTFTNPPNAKAWELIDKAGCRGLTRGGAMVSEKHCNFLINTGSATATDLESLGEEVRRKVFAASGIKLQWEIRRVGVPLDHTPKEVTQ